MQLQKLFANFFADPAINRQRFRLFVEDFLKRLAAQNTRNLYDTMLSETEQAYTDYFGRLADNDTAVAIRQNRTKSMNNVMMRFKNEVVRERKLITYFFKEDSPGYRDFFPGLTMEYHKANLDNVESLMTRMATASAKHEDVLGPEAAANFNSLLESFRQARGEQVAQKTVVGQTSNKIQNSRLALELQMTGNALQIAYLNKGKRDAHKLFFDESLLKEPRRKKGAVIPAAEAEL